MLGLKHNALTPVSRIQGEIKKQLLLLLLSTKLEKILLRGGYSSEERQKMLKRLNEDAETIL